MRQQRLPLKQPNEAELIATQALSYHVQLYNYRNSESQMRNRPSTPRLPVSFDLGNTNAAKIM